MHHTITITAEEIADEMRRSPEFGMDVIANLMSEFDPDNFAEEGIVSQFHEDAASGLRLLADAIEETMRAD